MPAKRLPPKKKPAKKLTKKRGRPSKFTEVLAKRIIAGLSNGTPLTIICQDAAMPCDDTVRAWTKIDPDFSRDIAGARDAGFDRIATRIRETARERGDSTGDVQRDKLIIETDLKLLAKWDPKRYGERMATEISGPDGGPMENVLSITPDIEERIKRLGVIRSTMKPPFGYADPG
jgi:hypothetical protein